jgi:hypothetical protein
MTVFHVDSKFSKWHTCKVINNAIKLCVELVFWTPCVTEIKETGYGSKHSSPKATFLILTTLSMMHHLGETGRFIYPT